MDKPEEIKKENEATVNKKKGGRKKLPDSDERVAVSLFVHKEVFAQFRAILLIQHVPVRAAIEDFMRDFVKKHQQKINVLMGKKGATLDYEIEGEENGEQ